MDLSSYFNKKKELNEIIVSFCTRDESDSDDGSKSLIDFIEKEKIGENIEELRIFLRIFSKVVSYHHRPRYFISKVKQIFSYLAENIKQSFSNLEIYNLFKGNKLLLKILLDLKIVTISNYIKDDLNHKCYNDKTKYYHFLYPELKDHLDEENRKKIEKELNEIDPDILPNFTQKLQEGENDSIFCQLSRQDSVMEFVAKFIQLDISPSFKISHSIFETNQFLIEGSLEPTVFQYAAFFGATRILQFIMSKCEPSQSLWTYAIHSNDYPLILFLEGYIPISNLDKALEVALQCHHNEIAEIILYRFDEIDEKKLINYCFEYDNFVFLPKDFDSDKDFIFQKLCEFNSPTLVSNFLSTYDLSQESIKKGFDAAFNRNCSPKYDYTYDVVKILSPKVGHFGESRIHVYTLFFFNRILNYIIFYQISKYIFFYSGIFFLIFLNDISQINFF